MREEKDQSALKEEQGVNPARPVFRETGHPWVDMPVEDDSLDETLRYTLDEIRYA